MNVLRTRCFWPLPPVFFLSIGLFLGGCLNEINLDVPPVESNSLVIRGFISTGDTTQIKVEITNLPEFKAFEIPEVVKDASVSVSDEAGNQLNVPINANGVYRLIIDQETHDFRVEAGKSYQLTVVTSDGRTYQSTLEPLHSVPQPSGLQFQKLKREFRNGIGGVVVKEYLDIRLRTPLIPAGSTEKVNLKWRMSGVAQFTEPPKFIDFITPDVRTCYLYEALNLDKVIVFNGRASRLDTLKNFHVLEKLVDYRLLEGYYLSVFQQSLSDEALAYWEKVYILVNQLGTVYDPPPGIVRGNIRNVNDPKEIVYGYFYATEEKVIRLFIPPGTVRAVDFCPPVINLDNYLDVNDFCFDCLIRPNSSLEKPPFWE